MPAFLKGSIIVNLIVCGCASLARAYSNSKLMGFVKGCGVCLKSSLVYGLIKRYFYKPAYFEYSLTYRFILWLVRVLDVPVGAVGRFFVYLTKGSLFTDSALALAESPLRDRFKVCGVTGVFISLGYGAGLFVKGADAIRFVPPLVILLISLVVFFMSYALDAVKYSVIFRVIKWFTK